MIRSFFNYEVLSGIFHCFGSIFFCHFLLLPHSLAIKGQIYYLTGIAFLAGKDQDIGLASSRHFRFEVKAKMFNHDDISFFVVSFNSLSGVTSFIDGLFVWCKISKLDIISSKPVVVFKQSDIDRPLQLRSWTDQFAAGQFPQTASTCHDAVLQLAGDSCGEKDSHQQIYFHDLIIR